MHWHPPRESAGRIGLAVFAFAARRWWPVAVAAAVLGALLGIVATSNPTYTSTLLVRVLSLTPDGVGFDNASQTALRLVQTDAVFQRAAEAVGDDSVALRARTTITRVTETDLLEIDVSGKSADQSKREAASIASAGRELMQDLSQDQVAQAALSSDQAVVSGVLPNGAAELARQQELGKSAATRQDVGLATALTLSPVGNPQSTRAGLSRSIAAAIGVLVGLLLGIAGAWVYGRRFGRLRQVGDVRATLPGAGAIDGGRLAGIAHRYSDQDKPFISLLALPEAVPELFELTMTLADELRTDGRKPYLLETADVAPTAPVGPDHRTEVADAHVVGGELLLGLNGNVNTRLSTDPQAAARPVAEPSRRPRPTPRPRPRGVRDDAVAASPVVTAVLSSEAPAEVGAAGMTTAGSPREDPSDAVEQINGHDALTSTNGHDLVSSTNGHDALVSTVTNGHGIMTSTDGPATASPTNGNTVESRFVPTIGRCRDRDLAVVGCDALLVSGGWKPAVAARIADRADVVLLVAKRGVTRLQDLSTASRELGDVDVIVILT